MRRILNLNQFGMVLVGMIGLFILVIPAVFYCLLLLLKEAEIISTLLRRGMTISFEIGAFVFVVSSVLIVAEQIQDHYIDVLHQKNQDRKLPLDNGNYECQYCGNQKVRENDKTCWVCGRALK